MHVLIRGVDSDRMRRKLLEAENLDLAKAIRLCQITESTKSELQILAGQNTDTKEEVAGISSKCRVGTPHMELSQRSFRSDQLANRDVKNGSQTGSPFGVCSRCGRSHRPRQCPAFGQLCKKCARRNHFARVCRAMVTQTHLVEESLKDEEDTFSENEDQLVLQIAVEKVGKKLLAKVPVVVNGREQTLECQLDTAASCNVMALRDLQKLGLPPFQKSNTKLTMYDSTMRGSKGKCQLQLTNQQGEVILLTFEVLETKHHTLLSLDSCLELHLLSYEVESVCLAEALQKVSKEQLLKDYQDVFSGLGCLPGEYCIELDPAVPPVQNRPRRIPYKMRKAVEEKLACMEKAGVIVKVESPTSWISNMTAVWKPGKAEVRVCLDPRDLNKAVNLNHFNMPMLDDVLPELTNAKVFSLLDAKDGFLQVRLSDQSSFLTTFWGPTCRFRWLRLLFGLSSAPEEFQRRLQAALYGIDGVAVVADDILIYGKGNTQEEARGNHNEALLQVLRRARKCNLKFNKDKLRLYLLPELQYIGHCISSEGVRPDPAKVAGIKDMPTPTTVTQVRSFLRMCNYLAKFVQNLSQATEPLRRLTENNVKFVWDEGEQRCFDQVKDLISGDLLLAYYDMSKPVTIHCDASMDGLGATLLQEGLPVMSVSRSLGKSEKNYVAIELECLAIVFACRKFDRYIYGKRTVVETDHKPLEVICKKSILAAPKRLQRMLLSLLRYDLVVVYRPGKEQVLADALSRLPVKTLEEELEQEVFQAELDAELLEISAVQGKDAVHGSDQRLLEVKKASVTDEEQKALQKLITQGWPTRFKEVPALAR